MARDTLSAKQDRHAQLREAVFAIASRIVQTEGLAGLQARRIAAEANCSVGTLYNACGNLDQVVLAANAASLDELKQALLAARGPPGQADGAGEPLEAALLRMAMAYLDFACHRRPVWRAIFEHRLTAETRVPDAYRAKQAELFAIVEDGLERAIGDPDLRRKVSRALFGAVHGVISLALDEKLSDFDEAATRAEVAFVVRAIASGLRDNTVTAESFRP